MNCPHCGKRINVGKLLRSKRPTAAQKEAARLNGSKGGRPKLQKAERPNHVIANGAKIEERLSGLGTIWPTKAALDAADAFADSMRAKALAAAEIELAGMEKRMVGGEVRYYKTPTLYTPAVKRGGVRRWFEVRKDGDYAVK